MFTGVSALHIPRDNPWGASVSINSICRGRDGLFEIEIQSGDVIRIAATDWAFDPTPNSAAAAHI